MYEVVLLFLIINSVRRNNIVKFERLCDFIDFYKKILCKRFLVYCKLFLVKMELMK